MDDLAASEVRDSRPAAGRPPLSGRLERYGLSALSVAATLATVLVFLSIYSATYECRRGCQVSPADKKYEREWFPPCCEQPYLTDL
jgi:hypothetical protein